MRECLLMLIIYGLGLGFVVCGLISHDGDINIAYMTVINMPGSIQPPVYHIHWYENHISYFFWEGWTFSQITLIKCLRQMRIRAR